MHNALRAAASGMLAQQLRIDTTANNLSNVNTPGFKANRATFQDLLYRAAPAGSAALAAVETGSGAAVAAVVRDHDSGVLNETGRQTDLAIDGEGFFRVRRADGGVAYTRAGSFQLDAQGRLVTASGHLLEPPITLPAGASDLTVDAAGLVRAKAADGGVLELGRIGLALFANPAGLSATGDGLLAETAASGPARILAPGDVGAGAVRQGQLEASNVSMMTEMTALIEAQRAFGMLSKLISTADEMHAIANSLKR